MPSLKTPIAFSLMALLFGAPAAMAQVQPAPTGTLLTMQQIEDLNNALAVLDRGTPDQCPPSAKESKDAKTPERPCSFHKSLPLLRAMARDMVALKDADAIFKTEQNGVRSEVLEKLPTDPEAAKVTAGESDVVAAHKTMAIRVIQGQQDVQFLDKMKAINAEQRKVPLDTIKLSDLDLGDPPDHNRIPAELIAALSPIIEDLMAAK
jgi:hypothetical protein